jgi:hypothetical protein
MICFLYDIFVNLKIHNVALNAIYICDFVDTVPPYKSYVILNYFMPKVIYF